MNQKNASAKIIGFLENCSSEFAPTSPGPALGTRDRIQQFSFQYNYFVLEFSKLRKKLESI